MGVHNIMANEYGNYATLNPLYPSSNVTLSNGNLTATFAGSNHYHFPANMLIPATGKWALKATDVNGAGRPSHQMIGVVEDNPASLTDGHDNATSVYWTDTGTVYRAGSSLGTQAASYTQNNVLQLLYDRDAATLKLYKDGVLSYTVTSVPTAANVFSAVANEGGTAVWTLDFGQNGYVATDADYLNLSTANLPEPAIINPDDHFFSTVIDHDGSSTAFTLPWNANTYDTLFIVKNTTGAAEDWYFTNGLRGYNKYQTCPTLVTETTSTTILTISGTSVTLGSTLGNKSYLVECHKAGLASGRVSDDTGARTVTRSTNTTSQFSIIQRTGTGANTNYGHGLDAVDWRISLNLSSAHSFSCQHTSLTDGTMILYMDGTGKQNAHATGWNSTFPSPTLCFLGSGNGVNQNNSTYNEYLWGPVAGYSAFGGYEGNGSTDGAFVNTGFAQQIMFVRNIDATENWVVKYQVLDNTNENTSRIYYDQTAVADTSTSSANMDMVSNGFKNRGSNSQSNSDATFIYASWGGTPIQGDGGVNQGRAK